MRGSIRSLVGFLLVFGAVGGIEQGGDLLVGVPVAVLGLAIMASGVLALRKE